MWSGCWHFCITLPEWCSCQSKLKLRARTHTPHRRSTPTHLGGVGHQRKAQGVCAALLDAVWEVGALGCRCLLNFLGVKVAAQQGAVQAVQGNALDDVDGVCQQKKGGKAAGG